MSQPSPSPPPPRRRPLPRTTRRPLPRPFTALRAAFAGGYRGGDLRADLGAGVVVGIVALPLSMALAVACGVPPQHGLYTAIVAGALTALAGGSAVQVTGPTAAFVVLLAPISATYGLGGLLLATVMAGLMLVAMGLARFGRLLQFVSYPVTAGFTAGIAIVIATLQVKDFLGLPVDELPPHLGGRLGVLAGALPETSWPDLAVGLFTLALLVVFPRLTRRVPAPLVALAAGAFLAAGLAVWAGADAATLGDRFTWRLGERAGSGVPPLPPVFSLPWTLPGPDGRPLGLSMELLRALLPSALAIAFLGAIESLLSAVISDGMSGRQHDPDGELLGQGLGNLVAPFFGGFAATGAIARTATNVRAGARSPLAAVVHALFVLAAMVALAPLLGDLPMASLAALLLVVAWNMAEARHFARVLSKAPRSDALVLLVCCGLTVVFDMVVAVAVGVVLAALLFMRRMAEVSDVVLVGEGGHPPVGGLPRNVVVYEVNGPLFFGATHKAMGALARVATGVDVVLLDLSEVPAIDATGLVNLGSAVDRLTAGGVFVVLGGVQEQPLRALLRGGWRERRGLAIHRDLGRAVDRARREAEAAGARAA
ncbi:MAG TPA: C4-dicarboxylic acid transporter DauA [Thermoanaerobaculia bacterium]|nr:C4-dicarboxylic acid transporter DauA [Thermoanaerobaculia bacterium]